jgi:hypothetical protein
MSNPKKPYDRTVHRPREIEQMIRYHPYLPRVQISRGRYGQRVGDIRKLCREGMPRNVKPRVRDWHRK